MVRKAGDSNPPIPPFPPPPPIISYKNGASLKDTLVKAKKKKIEGDYATRLHKSHGGGRVRAGLSIPYQISRK